MAQEGVIVQEEHQAHQEHFHLRRRVDVVIEIPLVLQFSPTSPPPPTTGGFGFQEEDPTEGYGLPTD
jgi:hypothetical protein